MISTDIFLEQGSQHKICQDYIIKGNIDHIPYIILSDGCSSSENTQTGAGILCHLTKQYLKYRLKLANPVDYNKLGSWVIHNAEMNVRQLGLSTSCLDATLIVAYEMDGKIHVLVYGDGVIIHKNKSFESKKIYKIDFVNSESEVPSNCPFYLSYLIDDFRYDLYHQMKNDKLITESVCTLSKTLSNSITRLAYDSKIELTFNKSDTELLLISSDGINSFIVEDPTKRKNINILYYLYNFMDFKTTKGEFLKRTVSFSLKDLKKEGIVHYDDLSIGALLISE